MKRVNYTGLTERVTVVDPREDQGTLAIVAVSREAGTFVASDWLMREGPP